MPCVAVLYYQRPAPMRNTAPLRSSLLNATQRFVCYLRSTLRVSPQRHSTPRTATICFLSTPLVAAMCIDARRNSTQRFVFYFFIAAARRTAPNRYAALCHSTHHHAPQVHSTICLLLRNASPLGYPPRTAPRLGSTRLNATQSNDLFIISATQLCESHRISPSRIASIRPAPLRSATRRFVCYFINATQRSAPRRPSTQLDDLFVTFLSPRFAAQRNATPLYSTICFLLYRRFASPLLASTRNSTQRFVCYFIISSQLNATQLIPTQRNATLLYSTICLFTSLLNSTMRGDTQRNSSLLNDLFILDAAQRSTSPRTATRLGSTPLNSTQLKPTNPIGEHNVPKITTNYKNLRYVSEM